MKKIVADIDIPYLSGVLEPYANVVYLKGIDITRADIADADALIIRTRTVCNRELLSDSKVRLIVTATIGYDHIDIEYCNASDIEVVTAAGCNSRGVLQWVSAVLASESRRFGWNPSQRTIGVVGVGHVGSLIAEYARSWGFKVLCCDPPRVEQESQNTANYDIKDFVSLDTIVSEADIITFHVPLNRAGAYPTYHMANESLFKKLKSGTLLLNSSRGEIIDTQALNSIIKSKYDIHCAIDTWEHEPHIDPFLLSHATIATTHIAGYTAQGKANGTAIAVNAIAARYGLPLTDWYPSESVTPSSPRNITWEQLLREIDSYCNPESETALLKSDPTQFEAHRNNYNYRTEFF